MKNLLFMALFALALYSCSKDENPSNTAPVIKAQAFTVAENINDTFVIGTVAATDADKDKLAFSIATNSGNLFEITSAGALSLASGKTLDFATKSQHVLSVNVSDGTATATDAEQDPLTFTITADASGLFEISDAGELSLSAGSSLDFATAAEHTLTVSVSDGNSAAQAQVTINVTDVVEDLALDPASFITTWETTSDMEAIQIGGDISFAYDFFIDWGDGTVENVMELVAGEFQNYYFEHIYQTAGTYTVALQGNFPTIRMDNSNTKNKLQSIEQWGNLPWQSMEAAFADCQNMVYNVTDVPNLSQVTNMHLMFSGCSNFNGDVTGWDVSNVTNMQDTFRSAFMFNQDISGWDVSSVTTMRSMFQGAASFNQNIGGWDVSSVTDMAKMFYGIPFNQDISAWDVSSVADFSEMFGYNTLFNQDIGSWNVSSAVSMLGMFAQTNSFNQDLSAWNVGNVINMQRMFRNAISFNQSLAEWDIGNVTNMDDMLTYSSLSTLNYSLTLQGWANANAPTGITLGATGLDYCNDQQTIGLRGYLLNTKQWTIDDGNAVQCF